MPPRPSSPSSSYPGTAGAPGGRARRWPGSVSGATRVGRSSGGGRVASAGNSVVRVGSIGSVMGGAGERVNAALYEVFTADWDEGLWDEEVERMRALIDPDTDTLIFWQVVGGRLARTCVAGRFA